MAVAAVVAALAGCQGSFEGSGTMRSTVTGKATTVLRIECSPSTQRVTGFVAFVDPAAKVVIKTAALVSAIDDTDYSDYYDYLDYLDGIGGLRPINPVGGSPLSCDNDADEGHYLGAYGAALPAPGVLPSVSSLPSGAGLFSYDVEANEDCTSGYEVSIAVSSGRYAGYNNDGCVTGKIRPLQVS